MAKRTKAARAKDQQKGSDGHSLDQDFLASVGGRKVYSRGPISRAYCDPGEEQWDFGYITEDRRTVENHIGVARAIAEMPPFHIVGSEDDEHKDAEKVLLFEVWKHPLVVESNGFAFEGIHQLTGSCVGAGGGNMWMTLIGWEVIKQNDQELAQIPFWLLPYGRSRMYCGMRTPGEGSTGSCFARAATTDGTVIAKQSGLPPFENTDGLIWGRQVELKWSDGDDQPQEWLDKAKPHLIKTAAKLRDHTEVQQAIKNGYPVTVASNYAHDGGKVQGNPPVLLARKQGSWSHQMSILAWWKHPEFGDLYYLMNQWGKRAHGICPTGAPNGGVWIKGSDVDWICRDEGFAFSQFNGFPAQRIPWSF